jgi:transposase InsO family protein
MEMEQITKIALAWDLHTQRVAKKHIAKYVVVNRKTIYRWIAHITQDHNNNLEQFLDSYLTAKKGKRSPRKVDAVVKRRVWQLRDNYHECCGQKIQYYLKRDYGFSLSVESIYKILREKYQLRTRWKKNKKRGIVPQATKPREVIQMDAVDFGGIFAFTAIDIYSREADVILRPYIQASDAQLFLHTSMRRRFNNHSDIIQTDNGNEFKAEFHTDTKLYCNRHRFARAYKKNEQAYIESFNRSLRKECLGWAHYQKYQIQQLTIYVNNWLDYYHYERPHLGLGMKTPVGHI